MPMKPDPNKLPRTEATDAALRGRITGGVLEREMSTPHVRAIDEENRTLELAFSSEYEVERWFGIELLDHSPNSVRMGRLENRASLLEDHNNSVRSILGVVEKAWIDGDRVGRARVRFSKRDQAQEVFRDIVDGIVGKVSIRYRIHDYDDSQQRDGATLFRVTDWEPQEISIVAVPADDSVGVGRAAESIHEDLAMPDKKPAAAAPEPQIDPKETPEQRTAPQPQAPEPAPQEPVAAANPDHDHMRSIGRKFGFEDLAGQYIELGRSLKEFQDAVWTAKRESLRPVPSVVEPHIEMRMPRRGKMRAFANNREGEELAYRSGMWARATIFGDPNAQRWCQDYGVRVMTGLTSGTSAVVPHEMVNSIIDLREQYGVARRYCFVHPMSSDTASIPRRKSGITAYFVNRAAAPTASDAAFDEVNLVARPVAALTRVSKEYAADAVIDLADHLVGEMAYAFAQKEDDCLFNGDGSNTYGGIYGIRPKIIDGTHTVGAVDAASNHDTLSEIDHDDLVGLTGALPEFPGINPSWFCSKRANSLVFDALKVAGGGNTMMDLAGKPMMSYLGDPIVISQVMPKVTTDLSNVAMIIYGDLRMGTTFGDRLGFEIDIARELYMTTREIGVHCWQRFDINIHGLGDTSEAGPIVALIGE